MNAITESFYKRAHRTHHHIPATESELEYAGLEVEWVEGVPLPVLKESPVRALLRFSEEHLLQVNQTRLLIFSIVWVEVRGEVGVDGFVALDELKVVAGSGCDAYYRAVAIGREVVQRERA
jgi:flavin reductase (DIM6/NTAB) family NADH-FMN oxidoreductase RutF